MEVVYFGTFIFIRAIFYFGQLSSKNKTFIGFTKIYNNWSLATEHWEFRIGLNQFLFEFKLIFSALKPQFCICGIQFSK